MKKIFQIIILFITTFTFSQVEEEITPPYNIKTISFVQGGNNVVPFFKLGEAFELQFDDLYNNEADYYFIIEQFNYDWTPTALLKNEYLNGLDNQRIQNYQNSFNCLQLYSHYKLSFPNKFTQIIKTGNYIVKILDEDQNIVFSRKFVVYEDNIVVGLTIKRSREMETINQKQNLDFFIDYKDKLLQNPMQNLKVALFQNGKFNNAIYNIKPQYTIGTQLIYRYNTETQFWAGNEYLNFDNKNIRGASNMVAKVTSGDIYNTILYTNEARKNKPYTFFPDINGNYFVTNFNAEQNEIEADYAWVYFGLYSDVNPLEKSIYVTGMFNNYQLSDEYKMDYNVDSKKFEKPILIKQGFTNYQYVVVDKTGKIDDKNAVDGNFYQTENDYVVLVYYKGPNDRYERVIGIARNNSTEIRN